MRFVATKGSVALDGVSLTVNEVTADTFAVLIIPHTLSVTTLGAAKPRRQDEPRNRPDGAICGAFDGDEAEGACSRDLILLPRGLTVRDHGRTETKTCR